MAKRYLIVVGDSTTGGGEAMEGYSGYMIECLDGSSRPAVALGHKVVCGQCGPTTVVEGCHFFFTNLLLAYDGCALACGHKLVATMQRLSSVEIVESQVASEPRTSATHFANGTAAGQSATKRVKRLFWTFGPTGTALGGESRFSPDLTLHIETESYTAGEAVEVTIEVSDGGNLSPDVQSLTLSAVVDATGTAKVENAFRDHSLLLHISENDSAAT